MGERLHRELQRPAPRRAARWRDLLQPARGTGRDRELEAPLQSGAPARLARLPRAGSRDSPASPRHTDDGTAPASRTNHPGHGPTTGHALTFTPDHPMGAGQIVLGYQTKCPEAKLQCAEECAADSK